MTANRPRFADQWAALAAVASKMVGVRAGKPDAPAWAAITADWDYVMTHARSSDARADPSARVEAAATAVIRARAQLAEIAIHDPDSLLQHDRLALTDSALALVEKHDLLSALAWHETRTDRLGRPMILLVTEVNIALGVSPPSVRIEQDRAEPRADRRDVAPEDESPARVFALPTSAEPKPQQARLI